MLYLPTLGKWYAGHIRFLTRGKEPRSRGKGTRVYTCHLLKHKRRIAASISRQKPVCPHYAKSVGMRGCTIRTNGLDRGQILDPV